MRIDDAERTIPIHNWAAKKVKEVPDSEAESEDDIQEDIQEDIHDAVDEGLGDEDLENFKGRFGGTMPDNLHLEGFKLSKNVLDFAEMLERRCLPEMDQETYQMQSPLMVGNSGNINRRTADHLPGQSLHNTPKLWGLLLSCLKVMNLKYEVIAVPLFRAWKNGKQVNDAEILGTILAGSLLNMDGCNAKHPGTRPIFGRTDDFGYENSKDHVFAGRPWFIENLRHSCRERETDERRIQEITEVMKEVDVRIKGLAEQIVKDRARLAEIQQEVQESMDP
ncbi:hypothetical protein F5Y04DRAFT_289132 [Hypomontagnella monticulosa]|nr:hypothetical protein F5Y04DRAFT_289132 [Hypomontagnella monticulosa]